MPPVSRWLPTQRREFAPPASQWLPTQRQPQQQEDLPAWQSELPGLQYSRRASGEQQWNPHDSPQAAAAAQQPHLLDQQQQQGLHSQQQQSQPQQAQQPSLAQQRLRRPLQELGAHNGVDGDGWMLEAAEPQPVRDSLVQRIQEAWQARQVRPPCSVAPCPACTCKCCTIG